MPVCKSLAVLFKIFAVVGVLSTNNYLVRTVCQVSGWTHNMLSICFTQQREEGQEVVFRGYLAFSIASTI